MTESDIHKNLKYDLADLAPKHGCTGRVETVTRYGSRADVCWFREGNPFLYFEILYKHTSRTIAIVVNDHSRLRRKHGVFGLRDDIRKHIRENNIGEGDQIRQIRINEFRNIIKQITHRKTDNGITKEIEKLVRSGIVKKNWSTSMFEVSLV